MDLYKLQKENPWDISRLIYQLGETGPSNAQNESQEKKPPPKETHEQLKLLRDDISAFERYRLEALEEFKRKILQGRHDFQGDDFNVNETLTNSVFQYLYSKLDAFLKTDINLDCPAESYKQWAAYVCDEMLVHLRRDITMHPITPDFRVVFQALFDSDPTVTKQKIDKHFRDLTRLGTFLRNLESE